MNFFPSLLIGLLLGFFSWAFWAIWAKKASSKKWVKQTTFAALSLIKLGVLGSAIWFLIAKVDIDLIGLLLGLSIQVVLTLWKGFRWSS